MSGRVLVLFRGFFRGHPAVISGGEGHLLEDMTPRQGERDRMLSSLEDLSALAEELRALVGEVQPGGGLSTESDVLALARDVLHRVIGLEVDLG